MQKNYLPGNITTSSKKIIDKELFYKWLQTPVNKNIDLYLDRLKYSLDTLDLNKATSGDDSFIKIDNTWSNDNILAKPNVLFWSSLVNDLIPQGFDVNFKHELTKLFSLISYVNKIYVEEITDYINIDILTNKKFLSNLELENLIDKEIELRNEFDAVIFNFNYFSKNNYFQKGSSTLIFENHV